MSAHIFCVCSLPCLHLFGVAIELPHWRRKEIRNAVRQESINNRLWNIKNWKLVKLIPSTALTSARLLPTCRKFGSGEGDMCKLWKKQWCGQKPRTDRRRKRNLCVPPRKRNSAETMRQKKDKRRETIVKFCWLLQLSIISKCDFVPDACVCKR